MSRQRFYELRKRDDAFAEEWVRACDEGTDRLEDEAFRRAVEGVSEPIFSKGEVVGERRVYSDRLIEFLLKARRPAIYREKSLVEVRRDPIHQREIEEALERFKQQVNADALRHLDASKGATVLGTQSDRPALPPHLEGRKLE